MTPEEIEAAEAAEAETKALEAEEAEKEAAKAEELARKRDADDAELAALREEKESWAKERVALEDKAKRIVQSPKPKSEKKPIENEPVKKKRNVSRWFGDDAYGDN